MLKNQTLTKWIYFLLGISLVLEILGLVGGATFFYLLQGVLQGNAINITEEELVQLEKYADLFDGLSILVAFILFVSWLSWLYKAHSNLSTIGATDLKYTDASCVWWNFIPIANLWKPYSAIKEIFTQSQRCATGEALPSKSGIILLVWWLLNIMSIILAIILFKMKEPETTEDALFQLKFCIAVYGFNIIFFTLLFYIIYQIYTLQHTAFNKPKPLSLQKES